MSCAGCDDCPQDAWHLHVTVERHDGMLGYISRTGYGIDMAQLGLKPVTVINKFPDPTRDYREWIPTLHYRGTEAKAVHTLFIMATNLVQMGYIPKRLKIEGDARRVREGRALYYETHLKHPTAPGPVSMNAKGARIVTIRRPTLKKIQGALYAMGFTTEDYRVEACVLDTAPEIDEEWLRCAC